MSTTENNTGNTADSADTGNSPNNNPKTGLPTTPPRRDVNKRYKLEFEKPLFLTDREQQWRKSRLSTGIAITVATVVMVLLVAIAFSARIVGGGVYWTTRAPLATGIPQVGDSVLLSSYSAGLRSNTRIFESLFRSHDIVKILALPGDELTYQGEFIAVNGTKIDYKANISGGSRLSANYLVVCEKGGCNPGMVFTAPTTNVLGKVSYNSYEESLKILEAQRAAAE